MMNLGETKEEKNKSFEIKNKVSMVVKNNNMLHLGG